LLQAIQDVGRCHHDPNANDTALKRWQHLAAAPHKITLPQMELLAGDREPPIVKGSGEIHLESPSSFEYTLSGFPDDVTYNLKQIQRQSSF